MNMWPTHIDHISEYDRAVNHLIYKSPYSKIVVDMIYLEKKAKMIQFLGHSNYITSHLNYPGFRNGPIPYTKTWKHGGWRPHRGKHSHSLLSEYKYDCGMLADMDDIYDLPIIHKHLLRCKRVAEVKFWSIEYDDFHDRYGKGRGWKRSRKQKQWNQQ